MSSQKRRLFLNSISSQQRGDHFGRPLAEPKDHHRKKSSHGSRTGSAAVQLAHPHSLAPGFFFCTRQGSIRVKDKIRYNGVRKNRKGGITMRESKFTSYDDLPLMLSAPEVAEVLGISRAGAYELVSSAGFPHMKIGNRILVPKDKFLKWIDAQTVTEVE
jgi:excisionase family DNA binding protein